MVCIFPEEAGSYLLEAKVARSWLRGESRACCSLRRPSPWRGELCPRPVPWQAEGEVAGTDPLLLSSSLVQVQLLISPLNRLSGSAPRRQTSIRGLHGLAAQAWLGKGAAAAGITFLRAGMTFLSPGVCKWAKITSRRGCWRSR